MKFIKIDLLTLLIGLFLFASCKDSNEVGLDLDPGTSPEGTLVDTLTINTKVLEEAPTETSTLTQHPFGYLNDPVFGKTDASISMVAGLPFVPYTYGTSPSLDSAVLVLNFGKEFYGDTTTSIYSIDVKPLNNNISQNEVFLSNKTYAAGSVVGNMTGYIHPTQSFKITDIVLGAPDTLKTVTAQIRIKIDPGYIQNNLFNLGAIALKNDETFAALFHGFKIELNKAASSGPLGMMFFDFATSNSKLDLYYKRPSSTAGKTDTLYESFPISTSLTPVAATISHDYSGTPVATQLANPNTQYAVSYLQGAVGVRNQLSFPHLKDFGQKVGKVVVNRAELVIDVSAGTDVAPYAPAPRLSLYRYDVASQRVNIPDRELYQSWYGSETAGDNLFGGVYDANKKRYIFYVTDYIQKMLDGKIEDFGTFLSVTPEATFIYKTPTATSAGRTVIGSGAKDAAGNLINSNNRVKLNIYYTKAN